MKKIFVLTLVLILLTGTTVTSAGAASATALKPVVVVINSWSGLAIPGDQLTVDLVLKNPNQDAVRFGGLILFPKATASLISEGMPEARPVEGGEKYNKFYVYALIANLKPGETRTFTFGIDLRTDLAGGQNPLVTMLDKWGVELGHRDVDIYVPSVIIGQSVPAEIMAGGKTIPMKFDAYNPANIAQWFDVEVTIFNKGTNKAIDYWDMEGDIYFVEGFSDRITFHWRGLVPPKDTYSWEILTYSGDVPGIYKLLEVTNLLTGERSWQSIQIVPTDVPYGRLKASPTGIKTRIEPDSLVMLESFYFSPIPGQFVIKSMSSDCPTQGLPLGSWSQPDLTFAYFLHHFTLLPMEKPAGITGEYQVTCHLSAAFYMWGTRYQANGEFIVTIP